MNNNHYSTVSPIRHVDLNSSSHVVLRRSVYSSVPHVINTGVQKPLTMNVTFLGTSSGGGPTLNRNCSSLVCDFFEGNNLWS